MKLRTVTNWIRVTMPGLVVMLFVTGIANITAGHIAVGVFALTIATWNAVVWAVTREP